MWQDTCTRPQQHCPQGGNRRKIHEQENGSLITGMLYTNENERTTSAGNNMGGPYRYKNHVYILTNIIWNKGHVVLFTESFQVDKTKAILIKDT